MSYLDRTFVLARLALAASLLLPAIGWRTPLLSSWRYSALTALILLPLLVIAFEIRTLRRAQPGSRASRLMSATSLSLAMVVLGTTSTLEAQFQYQRHIVLRTDPAQLERLGRHLLVGYRDRGTLDALIGRRAIAGVFISASNVQGKTAEAIRQQIHSLQEIRARQGVSPLWIATDQEGGAVSRLSPPLTRMPSLAEIVALHPDPAERQIAIRQYASRQGRELNDLGINLNFAPVVDLNHGIINPEDRLSRIGTRAISQDPAIVTDVARVYCATLMMTGVHCTLKHFPGLGRVYEDTHRVTAELSARAEELDASDWVPFRHLMASDAAFIMLGHVRLVAVDRDRPASFSNAVVDGLLRERWKHDGVLVTDDFSMGAVTHSREGVTGGAVAALNAGVDLILLSYDPDQYFPVMYALLRADGDGGLRSDMLERSDLRLRRAASRR
ncbi:MAG: glycoside hydrolase family 3 protein [Alphaproteobacteria bacterium]|nr:MAG: glycoside hydrolase family 3 protein [Alphaproteobacteria bacterium]